MLPFVIGVDALPPDGETFSLHFEAREVDELMAAAGWSGVAATGPLDATITAMPSGSDVFVIGRLSGAVGYECVRCLTGFSEPVRSEFHRAFAGLEDATRGERALRGEDLEVESLPTGELDLARVVAEEFFLSLSPYPTCRENCRGLCQSCGANLNEGACDCEAARRNSPFADLAKWSPGRR